MFWIHLRNVNELKHLDKTGDLSAHKLQTRTLLSSGMIGSELSVAVWIQCSKMSVGKRQQLMWEWPPLKHTLYLQIRYNAKTHTQKKKIQKRRSSCHTFAFRVDSITPRYKTTARECEQLDFYKSKDWTQHPAFSPVTFTTAFTIFV